MARVKKDLTRAEHTARAARDLSSSEVAFRLTEAYSRVSHYTIVARNLEDRTVSNNARLSEAHADVDGLTDLLKSRS